MISISIIRESSQLLLKHGASLEDIINIVYTQEKLDRHWDVLVDDVSDRIWAIFGSAVHSLMESEGENDFAEQEMTYKIGDITVTGRIDSYDMKHGLIDDYKTASVNKVKFKNFNDWYLQGMIYAWLLTNKCRFISLLKDHSPFNLIV
jgi:hypothetical protein